MVRQRIRGRFAGLLLFVGLAPACVGGRGAPASRGVPARGQSERANLVVAPDGSGDFRTIQEALDALPPDAPATRIILLRAGTYREKIFITKSRVALVGDDRERTRLVYSELRSEWRKTHPDDWGSAVVNVGEGVADLVLANLTIHNDYGSRGGSHDHQFAVRSGKGTTRISVLHADVIADGGDTISLWNSTSGMYYHASSTFEGYVDFFCPRGWSYVTDSRFSGHSTSASVWHDGSADEDQKLVIRSSRFDGVPGFALGRNTRDGQFYLLDCTFSNAMADRPIYLAREPETFRWGLRAYFWSCRRDGGDFLWFADNLSQAKGAPQAEEIDARWTFGGRWDPEATLPAVLPFASIPTPRNGARAVPASKVSLRWIGARNAVAYDLRLGRTDPPPVVARVEGTAYGPGPLVPGAVYFWRVDAVTPAGTVEGFVWRFVTGEQERGTGRNASMAER
jgi:pectinesterase